MTLRDAIYIIALISSVIAAYYAFKNEINSLKRDDKQQNKVLWEDQGQLNVICKSQCKEHRDQIFAAIRRSDNTIQQLFNKIDALNENVIRLMAIIERINGNKSNL